MDEPNDLQEAIASMIEVRPDDFRIYGPAELRRDDYPAAWPRINAWIVQEAGYRCERCGHPYRKGTHGPRGEWSPCDEHCTHAGPGRHRPDEVDYREQARPRSQEYPHIVDGWVYYDNGVTSWMIDKGLTVEARWRILTVHHLNGVKHDCRWWNLAALCQRCHLSIQSRVKMEQTYPFEHSDWFKPHAAGYYAFAYEDRDISREQAMDHLEHYLALERRL